jgi:hypothetical protein
MAFSADQNGHSGLWLAPLQTISNKLPVNTQSWSYSLAAGADLSSANAKTVSNDTSIGSILIGELHGIRLNDSSDLEQDAGIGALGSTANQLRMNVADPSNEGTRYEVVRTGTGDISVNAAGDVKLRNQFATIYTAGVALPDATQIRQAGDFVLPVVAFQPNSGSEQ